MPAGLAISPLGLMSGTKSTMHNLSEREQNSYYYYFIFASRARRTAHACRKRLD